jgi:hypothetical protein
MGGRAVECTGLEIRQGRKSFVGSNPTPSANRSDRGEAGFRRTRPPQASRHRDQSLRLGRVTGAPATLTAPFQSDAPSEHSPIRCATRTAAPVDEMAIDALAAMGQGALRKRQTRRFGR